MCDPVTAAIAVGGASTGIQSYMAYQEQKSKNQSADYNAAINEQNAKMAEDRRCIRRFNGTGYRKNE